MASRMPSTPMKSVSALRDEGFVVLGSGNVVHNLREADWKTRMARPRTSASTMRSSRL